MTDIERTEDGAPMSEVEMERSVRLAELLRLIPLQTVAGRRELDVVGATCDSRRVKPGYLFAAIDGHTVDGHRFVPDAIARGAVAVLSERAPESDAVTWIQTPDVRHGLGVVAARVASDPSRELDAVGVTGTNGKTTTSFLVDGLLSRLSPPSALMGTVIQKLGSQERATRFTTPEAPEVQRFLAGAVASGCRHAVLEVSSHGLALSRLTGTEFQVAVFTNLSRDHLDFHRDMEAYFLAKRELFTRYLRPGGVAVVCIDDAYGERLASELAGRVVTYGESETADLSIHEIDSSLTGTQVSFRDALASGGPSSAVIRSPLPGRYNGLNLVAAFAAVRALGYDGAEVLAAIEDVAGAPGRFERVETPLPFEIVVDYAHTDDALRKLLEAARPLTRGALWVVFGCGGERDRAKRPLMGDVATRLADHVVLTSDNPRGEDPMGIIGEIQLGVKSDSVDVEPDRRRAIGRALSQAAPEDLVVIAGKGHEPYQIVGSRVLDFDDREVARELARSIAEERSS